MSTPAIVHFASDREKTSSIYVHWDGYPEHMLPDLDDFFKAVEEETRDTRFGDPEYLAAKYVVYKARQFGEGLNFLSLGIVGPGRDYGQYYEYTVLCTDNERPSVTHSRN